MDTKIFVIDHPTKKENYLVHACLEGPEAGVYYRGIGKIINNNYAIIELPDYWDGLIDPETITVTLTQISYTQDLIVDGIEWGKIIVRADQDATTFEIYAS